MNNSQNMLHIKNKKNAVDQKRLTKRSVMHFGNKMQVTIDEDHE